jgi:hypothetical protein
MSSREGEGAAAGSSDVMQRAVLKFEQRGRAGALGPPFCVIRPKGQTKSSHGLCTMRNIITIQYFILLFI